MRDNEYVFYRKKQGRRIQYSGNVLIGDIINGKSVGEWSHGTNIMKANRKFGRGIKKINFILVN